jgi:hypothetical protein
MAITGANTVYDLFCCAQEWPELLPLIYELYDADRVHDVRLREILIDIRKGTYRRAEFEDELGNISYRSVGYSLAEIAERRCGIRLQKGADTWRLRYMELLGVPLDQLPPDARAYATDDAIATLAVDASQEAEAGEYLAQVEPDQVRASFALRTIGARGWLIDMDAVDELESALTAKRDAARPEFVAAGIYRASGTRNDKRVQELVEAAYKAKGVEVPRTAKGGVSKSAATLVESGDPLLEKLGAQAATEKLLTGFVPGLRVGANMPLCVEYETIVETGRTSCRGIKHIKSKGIQTQNMPRKVE